MKTLIKLFLVIVSAAICGWPTWLFLFIKSCLSPSGFWQNFLLFGFGIYVFGGLQIVFMLAFLASLLFISSKDF